VHNYTRKHTSTYLHAQTHQHTYTRKIQNVNVLLRTQLCLSCSHSLLPSNPCPAVFSVSFSCLFSSSFLAMLCSSSSPCSCSCSMSFSFSFSCLLLCSVFSLLSCACFLSYTHTCIRTVPVQHSPQHVLL